MGQLANVVLTDRATTPVNHTYVPLDITNGVGTCVESTGVPVGDNRITIAMKKSTDRYKPEVRLTLPVVQNQVVNGITTPTVVRTAYANLSFSFDSTSTLQERKDCVELARTALAAGTTVPNAVLTNLEGIY